MTRTLWTYVISMDKAEMLVDAVVDHQPEWQCPGKDKSKWTFRVRRFVGCGPASDDSDSEDSQLW